MKRMLGSMVVAFGVVVVGVLLQGCENSDNLSGDEFRVQPARVSFGTNDTTVAFTAIGGKNPLVWRITDTSLGNITGEGRTVTYTRTTKQGVNTVEVTDSQTWIAVATISQD
jgi:outer membrane lipoprotein SlyB